MNLFFCWQEHFQLKQIKTICFPPPPKNEDLDPSPRAQPPIMTVTRVKTKAGIAQRCFARHFPVRGKRGPEAFEAAFKSIRPAERVFIPQTPFEPFAESSVDRNPCFLFDSVLGRRRKFLAVFFSIAKKIS